MKEELIPDCEECQRTQKFCGFTPAWKLNGYPSKEAALAGMIKSLESNSKQIMKHGLDLDGEKQPIDFYVKERRFTLTKRGFLKK
jgi:hypothetical protein